MRSHTHTHTYLHACNADNEHDEDEDEDDDDDDGRTDVTNRSKQASRLLSSVISRFYCSCCCMRENDSMK